MPGKALAQNGLIAICVAFARRKRWAIGEVLYAAGFRVIEVPLNSRTVRKHPHPAQYLACQIIDRRLKKATP